MQEGSWWHQRRDPIHQEQVADAPVHQPVTTSCVKAVAASKVEWLTPGHAVEDVPGLEREQRHWRGQLDLPRGGAPLGAHSCEADAVDVGGKALENEAREIQRDVRPRILCARHRLSRSWKQRSRGAARVSVRLRYDIHPGNREAP